MAKPHQSRLPASPENAGLIDAHAGAQLRAARLALGWSQSKLGETAGVSFQQVQKYERGINRIAFSTLQKFANALNLPLEHFLHDTPVGPALATPDQRADYIASSQPDAAELLRLFESLPDDKTRAMLLKIARELVEKDGKAIDKYK